MSTQSETDSPLSQLQKAVLLHGRSRRPALRLPVFADRSDRVHGLLESIGTWIMEFDGSGGMVYSSGLSEAILGFTPEEVMGPDGIQFHPDDVAKVIEVGMKVRETGGPITNELRMRHKLGHWVWIASTLAGWVPTDDESFQTIAFARDITALKTAEAAKSESEARYRVVSEMSYDVITEANEAGRITYVGPGIEEVLGFTANEMIALEPFELVHPDDRDRVRAQYAAELVDMAAASTGPTRHRPRLLEFRLRHRDGSWLWFESVGVTYPRSDGETRYLSVNRNVTERRIAEHERQELQQGMQRAQKLESLGVLAGGIAHDFNNLLTPILGEAALGMQDLPKDSPVRERFQKIQRAAVQAAALTNQMLAYAGKEPLRTELLDISKLIGEMRELITSAIPRETTLDFHLASDLPAVEGEAAQLSQIVLNLVTNGAESIGDGIGTITVRTGEIDFKALPPKTLFAEEMLPGRHVFLDVTDTGSGMDAETCARIFEPFFSTKFTGRGLGLAVVAGIVKSHRGAIEVDSQPDSGTCFRVLLPTVSGSPAETIRSPERAAIDAWRTSGTVLVIDDDDGVRDLAEDILSGIGMHVLTATDGHSGAKQFALYADSIRMVLLDRTMPATSCADTLRAIRAVRADAKIVLVSGYSKERATADLAGLAVDGFIKKPFNPATLVTCIHELISQDS
jgi:two-component system cell cycle sensor histidine kinase/response regulator CckA